MPTTKNGKADQVLSLIAKALNRYKVDHPGSQVDAYRHTQRSIRVRVIDPSFSEIDKTDRENRVWSCLRGLPDDVADEIYILLPLAPEESAKSLANADFENPITVDL